MRLDSNFGRFMFALSSQVVWFFIFFLIVGGVLVIDTISAIIYKQPDWESPTVVSIILSTYILVLSLSLSYLYPGRLLFDKPPEIMFTSLELPRRESVAETDRMKDIIVIPFSCVNTGALAKSLTFALVLQIESPKELVSRTKYYTFTNDLRISTMNYAEWLRRRSENPARRWQELVDLDLMEPFLIESRSSASANCVFVPIDWERPISLAAGKIVMIHLFYRTKQPGLLRFNYIQRKLKEANAIDGYDPTVSLSPVTLTGGWKRAFVIRKRLPKDIESSYTLPSKPISMTRFEFRSNPSLWRVPHILLLEDLE